MTTFYFYFLIYQCFFPSSNVFLTQAVLFILLYTLKNITAETPFLQNFHTDRHVLSWHTGKWEQNLDVFLHWQGNLHNIWYSENTMLVNKTLSQSLILRLPFGAKMWTFIQVRYAFFSLHTIQKNYAQGFLSVVESQETLKTREHRYKASESMLHKNTLLK